MAIYQKAYCANGDYNDNEWVKSKILEGLSNYEKDIMKKLLNKVQNGVIDGKYIGITKQEWDNAELQ